MVISGAKSLPSDCKEGMDVQEGFNWNMSLSCIVGNVGFSLVCVLTSEIGVIYENQATQWNDQTLKHVAHTPQHQKPSNATMKRLSWGQPCRKQSPSVTFAVSGVTSQLAGTLSDVINRRMIQFAPWGFLKVKKERYWVLQYLLTHLLKGSFSSLLLPRDR